MYEDRGEEYQDNKIVEKTFGCVIKINVLLVLRDFQIIRLRTGYIFSINPQLKRGKCAITQYVYYNIRN